MVVRIINENITGEIEKETRYAKIEIICIATDRARIYWMCGMSTEDEVRSDFLQVARP